MHHLQIMESLGGDQFWIDRFAAQHAAVFYYWVIVFFFAFSPELAYVFSELVEVSRYLPYFSKAVLLEAPSRCLIVSNALCAVCNAPRGPLTRSPAMCLKLAWVGSSWGLSGLVEIRDHEQAGLYRACACLE